MPGTPPIVLFDLDGTLSDSQPGIVTSLRHAFAVNGFPPLDPEVERSLLGPPFYQSLPPLIGGEERLPAMIAAYRDRYVTQGAMYDTVAYAGVRELLAAAQDAGVRMAVATSKPEPYAVPIVEHLGFDGFFDTVGGDAPDGSRPSKALVIAMVLERLGRPDPADVVMVGDREHDVIGARAHGIRCLGAGWGYGADGELEAAGADPVCATPADLATALGLGSGDAATA